MRNIFASIEKSFCTVIYVQIPKCTCESFCLKFETDLIYQSNNLKRSKFNHCLFYFLVPGHSKANNASSKRIYFNLVELVPKIKPHSLTTDKHLQ